MTHRNANAEGRTAFLFGAQGAQWPGMGCDLLERDAAFHEAIVLCEQEIERIAGWNLRHELTAPAERYRLMDDPKFVQPALTALQIGLASALRARGVEPDGIGALSMGEAAAAWCAGSIHLAEAIEIAKATAELAETPLRPGGMAFLRTTWAEAERRLHGYQDRAARAVELGSDLTIIAGEREAVDALIARAARDGIAAGPMPLPQAYHTPAVRPLRPRFVRSLSRVRPHPADIPFYSSAVGARHRLEDSSPEHWWSICSEPSLFFRLARAMVADGVRTFMEISPHPMLEHSIHDAAASLDQKVEVYPLMSRAHGAEDLDEAVRALQTQGLAPA